MAGWRFRSKTWSRSANEQTTEWGNGANNSVFQFFFLALLFGLRFRDLTPARTAALSFFLNAMVFDAVGCGCNAITSGIWSRPGILKADWPPTCWIPHSALDCNCSFVKVNVLLKNQVRRTVNLPARFASIWFFYLPVRWVPFEWNMLVLLFESSPSFADEWGRPDPLRFYHFT